MTDSKQTRTGPTVFPDSMVAGPHRLGDPDDRSLRIMEKDILIRKRGVEAAKIQCKSCMDAYASCEQREQLKVYFKCKTEAKALENCLNKWTNDENFMAKVTEEYLDERAEYRRTGKSKKQREHDAMIERYRQKKAADDLAQANPST